MTKFYTLVALLLCSTAYATDVSKLANNKEAVSKQISENDKESALAWSLSNSLNPMLLKQSSLQVLQRSLNSLTSRDTICDLSLQQILQSEALKERVIQTDNDFIFFITYLRMENIIDDLLYKILNDSMIINQKLKISLDAHASRPLNLYNRKNDDVDIKKLYADFKNYPDEKNNCSIGLYFGVAGSLKIKNQNDLSRQLKRLNYLAYNEEIIDLPTYNKLEILRSEEALAWPVYIKRYLDVIDSAKDKLTTQSTQLSSSNEFSSNYSSRKQKLTQRGRLYKYYDSTQIIMLAQLIEKAGKRRDAYSAVLTFQYTEESSESENYVLSPMEKYRASIKMLRNDMGALMRSDNFRGVQVQYEDLISAAYETGLIKDGELDHILKFEEMWNPKTPKWKAYTSFAFSLAGTAAFYLPPPFNFLGAIALVFTQTKISGGKKDPNPEDSWNIII